MSVGSAQQPEDRVRGIDLCGVIQVRIDVRRGRNIAVAEPFLNILQRHAVGVEQARAGMPQIVEAHMPEAVLLQKGLKLSGERIRCHQLSELVDIDILQIILAIAPAAEVTVGGLLQLQVLQKLLHLRHQRQRAKAGLGFGAVLLYNLPFAVYDHFRDRVADRDGLGVEIDGVPLQSNDLAAAQAVERCHDDAELHRLAFGFFEKIVQLFLVVRFTDKLGFLRS